MLTKNLFPKLGLVNGAIGIVHEIILEYIISNSDALFIKLPLHVSIDFNSFIIKYNSYLNVIVIGSLPKYTISIAPISKSFQYI